MNWTAQQLETALGMTGITLENSVITEGAGLNLATANTRLQLCLAANKLPPDAEAYQVRAWMIRSGISPASIPTMIAAAVPEGPQRDALFAQLLAQHVENGSAINMAASLEVDAVIDPADTRIWLARALRAGRTGQLRGGMVDSW